jgi:hypothetical protein
MAATRHHNNPNVNGPEKPFFHAMVSLQKSLQTSNSDKNNTNQARKKAEYRPVRTTSRPCNRHLKNSEKKIFHIY